MGRVYVFSGAADSQPTVVDDPNIEDDRAHLLNAMIFGFTQNDTTERIKGIIDKYYPPAPQGNGVRLWKR